MAQVTTTLTLAAHLVPSLNFCVKTLPGQSKKMGIAFDITTFKLAFGITDI